MFLSFWPLWDTHAPGNKNPVVGGKELMNIFWGGCTLILPSPWTHVCVKILAPWPEPLPSSEPEHWREPASPPSRWRPGCFWRWTRWPWPSTRPRDDPERRVTTTRRSPPSSTSRATSRTRPSSPRCCTCRRRQEVSWRNGNKPLKSK